jgi:hypothetical protein
MRLIPSSMVCCKCVSRISWCVDATVKDSYLWRCRRAVSPSAFCALNSSRHRTLFYRSDRNITEVLFLSYDIVRRVSAHTIHEWHQLRQIPSLAFTGGVRSTWGLGPTMTARDQSISISIGMLPQTLIMSRLDQLSRLGERIYFFHYS